MLASQQSNPVVPTIRFISNKRRLAEIPLRGNRPYAGVRQRCVGGLVENRRQGVVERQNSAFCAVVRRFQIRSNAVPRRRLQYSRSVSFLRRTLWCRSRFLEKLSDFELGRWRRALEWVGGGETNSAGVQSEGRRIRT